MKFRGDERGAAIQIGAVILFAFIVIAMASYQATVVPDQNSGVEFNHNQDVQSQMVDLTNGIDASARDGTRGAHSVRLGTTYPSRTFFVNPGSPGGQLRTVESGEIQFEDIVVSDEEPDNVGTYWNDPDAFSTTRLQYEPNYNEYRSAPRTVYEHGELINDNPQGTSTTLRGGTIVDNDDEITLIALRGDVGSASSSTISVDRRSLSTGTNVVKIESGDVTIPTEETEYWERQFEDRDGVDVTPDPDNNRVTLEFDAAEIDGDEFTLRMAQVGVGSVSQDGPNDRARYLYQVDTATVEVRDRFNNPVSGATIEVDGDVETTDGDGRFSVGANRVGDDITWTIGDGMDEQELTETVQESDVGAGSGGSGGTSTYDIKWSDPQPDGNVQPGDTADYEVVRGTGDTIFVAETDPDDINGANTDFYYRDRDNTGVSIKSEETEFRDGTAEVELRDFDELGEFDLFVASGGHEERITVEVVSDATGTLDGQITDPNGDPLANTDVTISGDGLDETVTTDGDGNYEITDVQVGTYEDVTANADGYAASDPETFEINEDQTTAQNFELGEADGPIFAVTDLDAPEEAEQEELITVESTVENGGNEPGSVDVELRLGQDVSGEEETDYEVLAVKTDVEIDGEGGTQDVVFEDVEIPSDQELGEQEIGVEADGDVLSQAIEIISPSSEPNFEELLATVTASSGESGNINSIEIDGTIEDVDSDGTIEFEVLANEADQDDSPRAISMVGNFDTQEFDIDNEQELDIAVRLLDSDGNVYVSCQTDDSLTDDNSPLTLENGDFTCQ